MLNELVYVQPLLVPRMAFEKIIVLDDEMIIRKTLQEQLRKRRYSVAAVGSLAEAQVLLAKDNFDLIFVDVHLPDGEGTDLLEPLSRVPNSPIVVVMTGDGSIQSAVECMRKGAFDYIIKPFDIEQIEVVIKKAESFAHLVRVNQYFNQELQQHSASLIGESGPMKQLRGMVKKVAATEATVLICGENGTGKELIAQELYRSSSRVDQPYIRVNCAAIAENLMESEFFGHEKGSFTGATQRREGRFELANGGTILLDEISEISAKLQAKLLRVLQEREFERVGGNKTIKVDVRVIATTNRDLQEAVKQGDFREDLYYRLNVFPVYVPPLRERGGDIELLANDFIERFSQKHGKIIKGFSKKAKACMEMYPWPGNVRELQNSVERAVILTDSGNHIEESVLGISLEEKTCEVMSLECLEKKYILKALEEVSGDKKKAAEMLEIGLKVLNRKIKEHEIAI